MPSRNGPPAIIANFKASKIKKLNSSFLGITPATPIFCDDHLIPENKRVLATAKQLKKEGVLKYVWWRDCTINMPMSDNTPMITIHNESQINDIIEKLEKSGTFQSQHQNQSGETRKRTNEARRPEEDENLTT